MIQPAVIAPQAVVRDHRGGAVVRTVAAGQW